MENIISLLSDPFTRGVLLGITVAIIVYLRAILRRRELKKEVDRLRNHLHTKLEIDSSDNERRKNALETLKKERDNLKITVQSLNHKPGRKEIRQFYIYQTALDIMFEKAPGFAPAWQITLKEAEKVYEDSEQGLVPLIKRLMPASPSKHIEDFEKISKNTPTPDTKRNEH